MRHIATLIAAIFFVGTMPYVAAQPRLSLAKTTHNYGTLQESDGFVASKFSFTNTGDKPLIILYANASCGCTTPIYPEAPIAAGDTASIIIRYNTEGRPGAFSKVVQIHTNASTTPTTIHIRGNVEASATPDVDTSKYPFELGGVRLTNIHIPFFKLAHNAQVSKEIALINNSNKPLCIEASSIPPHLQVALPASTLAPRQECTLQVTYHATQIAELGQRQDSLLLSIYDGDKLVAEREITISANIIEETK